MNRNALLLATVCLCAYSLNAEEIDKADEHLMKQLTQLSMGELFGVEVQVASKTLETVFEAPSSVTIFTRPELQAMGLTSVEELLNLVPGFFSSHEIVFGSGYTVSARGRSSPQASYNILFMLDGEQLNDETSGGALTINRYIPLQNVKQVEIIRGPGSALYGTSAFLGVVNIITDESDNRAFVSAGNFDYHEASVQAAKHTKNLDISAFARYFKDQGADYSDALLGSDPLKGTDVSVSLFYQQLSLKLRHTQRQVARPDIEPATPEIPNYSKSEQTNLHLEYKTAENLKFDWTVRLSYMNEASDSLWHDKTAELVLADLLYKPTLDPTELENATLLSGVISKENSWRISWDGHYVLNPKHEFFAGLTWRRSQNEKSRDQNNFDYGAGLSVFYDNQNLPIAYYSSVVETGVNIAEVERDVLGLYLQSKHTLTEQLSATLGVRYDEYSDFGNSINPRLAFLYSPKSTTQFKLMYGEAFRAPSLRQLSSNLTGNSELKAEKIKTAELAWLQDYSYKKLQTTLTYFHNWHSDLIDTVPSPSNSLLRHFVNLPGTIETSGWELEANIKPSEHFSVRLAYSYMNTTEESPQYYPQQNLALILNAQFEKLNVNLRSQFHDAVEYNVSARKRIELDSYWRLDATARYNLANNLYLVGQITNLLDEDYYSSSRERGMLLGLPNRGRAANLGIEFSW